MPGLSIEDSILGEGVDGAVSKGYTGINPMTGNFLIDETINRAARKKGQWEREPDGDYDLFDRAGYIEASLKVGRPVAITWISSMFRLHCRDYQDIYGVSDIFGIEEITTLFSGKKRMESHRIFLIPYLITGYDIPPELEQDPEPLVPFTAKTIEMIKGIRNES